MSNELLDFKQASEFATRYIKKEVTVSNISYLVQYGRVPKIRNNGNPTIRKTDLIAYYDIYHSPKAEKWREKLDCNKILFGQN